MSDEFLLPLGFKAAGSSCGIKSESDKHDLALFVSGRPCTAAGVFTQNPVCGAPVKVSRRCVPRATARAVVINSGNANACTGDRGLEDARWMTAETGRLLACAQEDVLVCSTGVIGRFLPREKLAAGLPVLVEKLADTPRAFEDAARGMMTTDTVHKQAVQDMRLNGHIVRVAGAAKGAAMIGPNMATMLAVVMTDAPLEPRQADAILRAAVNRSFNCISVEGHTSTSDSVILLAGGAAETGPLNDGDRQQLAEAVGQVTRQLAVAIVRDAEGADHFIQLEVRGLRTREDAYRIAKTVADSVLVKTAIAGADPNWGRIVSAAGYAGVELCEEDISLAINGMPIYKQGAPVDYDEKSVSAGLRSERDVHIELDFDAGHESIRFWTSDLTTEYVRLNSERTT